MDLWIYLRWTVLDCCSSRCPPGVVLKAGAEASHLQQARPVPPPTIHRIPPEPLCPKHTPLISQLTPEPNRYPRMRNGSCSQITTGDSYRGGECLLQSQPDNKVQSWGGIYLTFNSKNIKNPLVTEHRNESSVLVRLHPQSSPWHQPSSSKAGGTVTFCSRRRKSLRLPGRDHTLAPRRWRSRLSHRWKQSWWTLLVFQPLTEKRWRFREEGSGMRLLKAPCNPRVALRGGG